MATMKPTTGYKTLQNGVKPYVSDNDVYVNIWDAKSQVVGILRFTESIASTLGFPSGINWSDIEITKAILTLKIFKNNNQNSGYTIAVSGTTLTSSMTQTTATITNGSYYTTGNSFASGTALKDQIITFNLKDLFNNIPDGNSSKPNTDTWYIYIWHSIYNYGTEDKYSYGFHKNEIKPSGSTINATLEIEGYNKKDKKGKVGYYNGSSWETCQIKYYVDNTTGWKDCEAKYWDGSAWVPVGGPP